VAIGWSWKILAVSSILLRANKLLTIVVLLGNIIRKVDWITAVFLQQSLFNKRTVGFRDLLVSICKTG